MGYHRRLNFSASYDNRDFSNVPSRYFRGAKGDNRRDLANDDSTRAIVCARRAKHDRPFDVIKRAGGQALPLTTCRLAKKIDFDHKFDIPQVNWHNERVRRCLMYLAASANCAYAVRGHE